MLPLVINVITNYVNLSSVSLKNRFKQTACIMAPTHRFALQTITGKKPETGLHIAEEICNL